MPLKHYRPRGISGQFVIDESRSGTLFIYSLSRACEGTKRTATSQTAARRKCIATQRVGLGEKYVWSSRSCRMPLPSPFLLNTHSNPAFSYLILRELPAGVYDWLPDLCNGRGLSADGPRYLVHDLLCSPRPQSIIAYHPTRHYLQGAIPSMITHPHLSFQIKHSDSDTRIDRSAAALRRSSPESVGTVAHPLPRALPHPGSIHGTTVSSHVSSTSSHTVPHPSFSGCNRLSCSPQHLHC